MFQIKAEHVRRVSFATKLFPKTNSAIGLETSKLKSTDRFDGELFCGGRSKNRDLLTFFGFIRDAGGSSASFVQLPSFRRSLKKLTSLVEQELETLGAHEVLLPTLVPQKLWHQSQRLSREPSALDHVYKLTDNSDNKLLLGPTFEESITKLIGDGAESVHESELPILLYQTSPKFRLEPNPRFGLIRSNEFLMNDLYSFDANLEQAKETYDAVSSAYNRIFNKLGLECVKVESGTGSIGGKLSHEYQLSVSSGEDTMIKCNSCHYACNLEMYSNTKMAIKTTGEYSCLKCGSTNIHRTQALELGHTFLLSDTYSAPMKAKFTSKDGKSRLNFEMGCYGLGLTRILSAGVDLLSIIPSAENYDDLLQLRWPNGVEPYKVGIVAPAKRSRQHHGGSSEFIDKIVTMVLESTKNLDLLIEDRDKEGIARRVIKLKSLGIPYIITVGQRFLQDQPEVELLKLEPEKKVYEQHWLNSDQLYDFVKRLDN